MASGKITKRSVDAVVAPEKGSKGRAYLWDDEIKGFGLMITDSGARSYILQYRIGGRSGRTRRVTIGRHGSPWTPDGARNRARELLEQVRRQIDPFDLERSKIVAQRDLEERAKLQKSVDERLGFSAFADRFIDRHAKVHQPRTWRDTESIVRRDLKPFFKDTPLPSITPADVVELLDKVHERGDSAAIKAYKTLRSLFAFAIAKEMRHMPAAASPMLGVKPPAKIGKRDRSLSDNELRLVWIAAGDLGWPFGPIIRLLILTGQRRDEVGELRWPELDLKAKRWLLPKERAKNGIEHLIPLSAPALEIVEALPKLKPPIRAPHDQTTERKPDQSLVFTTTGVTPVSGFSKIKRRLDHHILKLLQREALDGGATEEEVRGVFVADWRLHDLRRTLASGCQRLGIPLEVSESILNHVGGTRAGIAGVYHVYRYENEKHAALDAWASHVLEIVDKRALATENTDLEILQ